MAGTSPFTLQSPSYHSSSYLPKLEALEASFMRDFSCCGITLPTLHDLLQHYEEVHAPKKAQPPNNHHVSHGSSGNHGHPPLSGTHQAQGSSQTPRPISQAGNNHPAPQLGNSNTTAAPTSAAPPTSSAASSRTFAAPMPSTDTSELDTVGEMEMDEPLEEPGFPHHHTHPHHPSALSSPRGTPLGGTHQFGGMPHPAPLNLSSMFPGNHPHLRSSTPGTSTSGGRPLQNNPTVSSVNTPTLMAHGLQGQHHGHAHHGHSHGGHHASTSHLRSTPDSSSPGTPGAPDDIDDAIADEIGELAVATGHSHIGTSHANGQFGTFGAATGGPGGPGGGPTIVGGPLCIDEPAKRLFSPTGAGGFNPQAAATQQQNALFRLGQSQYGPNSQIAQRIREQQMRAGLPDTTSGLLPNEEPKPFRCPVIGCEKAYKNQNGLKYHKAVCYYLLFKPLFWKNVLTVTARP